MNKLATLITVGVILLTRIVITLTFVHFVYSVSPPHALTFVIAYLVMMIGERNILSLMKEEK